MRIFSYSTLVFFALFVAPVASAASLQVLDYSECSHSFGLVSCDQQTEVCAIKPDTGLPGCVVKTNVTNFVDYDTRYSSLVTCNQQSNCPYACTENKLQPGWEFYCSKSPPTPTRTQPTTAPIGSAIPTTRQTPGGINSQPDTNQVRSAPDTINNSAANTGSVITLANPLKLGECNTNGTCLEAFLNAILDLVIRIGTIIIILMIVFVGYKFVAARGNESELTSAKTMLLWTIIGALILLGAKAISLSLLATVRALGG